MDDIAERIERVRRQWTGLREAERDERKFNPAEARIPGGKGGGRWTKGGATVGDAVKGALGTGTRASDLDERGKAALKTNLKKYRLTQRGLEDELESVVGLSHAGKSRQWYPQAHKYAESLGKKHGLSTEQAAGVISALSPRTKWPRNKVLAEHVLTEYKKYEGLSPVDAAHRIGGGLSANIAAAVRIARGEDVSTTLTGVKRRSFYNNILVPGKTDDVTVDQWMQEVASRVSKRKMTVDDALDFTNAHKTVTNGAGAGYISIADAVRAVAKRNGLSPDELQAIYWTEVSGSAEGSAG